MDRIPSNIIFDIFSRVPARCLARSRCVSTVWCKYIDDCYLTIIHDKRVVEEPTPILYHQHLCIKNITLSLCFHVSESIQAGTTDLVFEPTKGPFLEFLRKKPLSRSSIVKPYLLMAVCIGWSVISTSKPKMVEEKSCRFEEESVPDGYIDVIGCWNKDGDILIKCRMRAMEGISSSFTT
ncbi:F-box domain containing protein [Tanacetum coccineum]